MVPPVPVLTLFQVEPLSVLNCHWKVGLDAVVEAAVNEAVEPAQAVAGLGSVVTVNGGQPMARSLN